LQQQARLADAGGGYFRVGRGPAAAVSAPRPRTTARCRRATAFALLNLVALQERTTDARYADLLAAAR